MIKMLIRLLFLILILAVALELILRLQFGFCTSPLYLSDEDYEYIYAPNQHVKRFGNVIKTNSLSMRNEELSQVETMNILLVGDSVINGGSLTDQDSIASTMLEKRLRKELNDKIRVFNISAGSWGPDNVAGYLKKHGLFQAKLIFLVTSSHDVHDIMSGSSPVGIDPGMPAVQYKLALIELWVRYRELIIYSLKERLFVPLENLATSSSTSENEKVSPEVSNLDQEGITKDGIGFNPGYAQLDSISKINNIPFAIYLHPETSEVEMGHFNTQGKEVIQFCLENNIEFYNEFDYGIKLDLFREMDVVHYNNKGQKFLAGNLYPILFEHLKDKN